MVLGPSADPHLIYFDSCVLDAHFEMLIFSENAERHIVSASFAAALAGPERAQAVSLPIVMSRRPA